MGESGSATDTTAALLRGRESICLHHLWATLTGDKQAAPVAGWSPYIVAMARPGIAVSSSSYYRSVYVSADPVRVLVAKKLEIPVLAITGERASAPIIKLWPAPLRATWQETSSYPGQDTSSRKNGQTKFAAALKTFPAN
jgi:hypothetical protein